jgi:hypothetical protein
MAAATVTSPTTISDDFKVSPKLMGLVGHHSPLVGPLDSTIVTPVIPTPQSSGSPPSDLFYSILVCQIHH